MADLPANLHWLRGTAALLSACVSLVSVVLQLQKTATDCSELHWKWNRLAGLLEILRHNPEEAHAPQEFKRLADQAAELSKSGSSIKLKQRVLDKWKQHVFTKYQ
jgi:hypothetical protein